MQHRCKHPIPQIGPHQGGQPKLHPDREHPQGTAQGHHSHEPQPKPQQQVLLGHPLQGSRQGPKDLQALHGVGQELQEGQQGPQVGHLANRRRQAQQLQPQQLPAAAGAEGLPEQAQGLQARGFRHGHAARRATIAT